LGLQGYAVLGINPAHTKKAKEFEDNSPEKSDPKDARLIADLAAEGRGRLVRRMAGGSRNVPKLNHRIFSGFQHPGMGPIVLFRGRQKTR
jgi:hypothetical protein